MKFPERLRELIEKNGMDVKTFVEDFKSKELGVSVSNSTMSNLLRGKTECNYSTVIAFAKYFNVSTDYLLGLSDTKTLDLNLKKASYSFGLDPDTMSEYVKILSDTNGKQNTWTESAIFALNYLLYDEVNNHYLYKNNQFGSLLESIGNIMYQSEEEAGNPGHFTQTMQSLGELVNSKNAKINLSFHEYVRILCNDITSSLVNMDENENFKKFCQRWHIFKKDYDMHNTLLKHNKKDESSC